MTKPPSIVAFERYWWGSAALALFSAILSWDRVRGSIAANFAADPRFRNDPTAAAVADWAQPFNVALMLGWTALAWWLVVPRQSRAGRVLVVISAVVSGLQLLILLGGLAFGRSFHLLPQASATGAAVLAILAAAALFRPHARTWFGDFDVADEEAEA